VEVIGIVFFLAVVVAGDLFMDHPGQETGRTDPAVAGKAESQKGKAQDDADDFHTIRIVNVFGNASPL